MTKYTYTFKDKENLAYAVGRDLSISPRHSIEICNSIRHKKLARAKAILQNVADLKEAIPFRKFTFDLGHKAKMGPGRYPVNAATAILKVIESAEANAKNANMDVASLYVAIAVTQKAPQPYRYGRHSRRRSKRAHIEIALKESKKDDSKKDAKAKEAKSSEAKSEKPKAKTAKPAAKEE